MLSEGPFPFECLFAFEGDFGQVEALPMTLSKKSSLHTALFSVSAPALLSALGLAFACGSPADEPSGDGDGDGDGTGQTGGLSGDGDAASGGLAGDGDMPTGGISGGGGSSTGGITGDGDGDGDGSGGEDGTGGTSSGSAFTCPSGSESMVLDLSGKTATDVGGVPAPAMDNWFLEGAVWIDGALYMSQIRDYGPLNPAHILKYTPGGAFETLIADSGTNGLAVNGSGDLVAASHAVGGIVTFDPSSPAASPATVSAMYEGSRFNSPNDLTIRSDGTIYFTDPDWQCGDCGHQPVKGVYRIPPGGAPERLTVLQDNPNGIALSPDEGILYVGGNSLSSHPVNADGSIGTGTPFGENFFGSTDGLGVDCAGNLYVTTNGTVTVFSPSGANLGQIAADGATNVAFGGSSSTTLYIVGFGSPGTLRSVELNVPGFPY